MSYVGGMDGMDLMVVSGLGRLGGLGAVASSPNCRAPDDNMALPAKGPSQPWAFPIPGGYVTSLYENRFHPVDKAWRFHSGLDIGHAQGVGAAILAPADGTVVVRSDDVNKPEGRYIMFEHDDAWKTSYAHLMTTPHQKGSRVRRGELLAYMGNTGKSTGPHLHWSAFDPCNNRVNPLVGLKGSFPQKGGGSVRGMYPGVGAGLVVGLALLGGAVWWVTRRKRR